MILYWKIILVCEIHHLKVVRGQSSLLGFYFRRHHFIAAQLCTSMLTRQFMICRVNYFATFWPVSLLIFALAKINTARMPCTYVTVVVVDVKLFRYFQPPCKGMCTLNSSKAHIFPALVLFSLNERSCSVKALKPLHCLRRLSGSTGSVECSSEVVIDDRVSLAKVYGFE